MMIKVKALTKRFDEVTALEGLDLHVPAGAIYGLVGPNGSGKTTLINHLAGVYRQDSGDISIDGQPVYENPAVKERIATIPDDPWFSPVSSLREMKRFYKGIYPRFDEVRYDKLKEVFHLDEKRPIRKMSKGMKKQAAFWLSICLRPELLLLDEPLDGLDPVMRRQVLSILMSDVAETGTTVLLSSHVLREMDDVCEHIGVLHKGRLLLEGRLSDLQGGTVKLQVAFETPELPALPDSLTVLHTSHMGKVHLLIVRGMPDEVRARIAPLSPLILEILPLSLEEIFLYELGGEGYAVKDILL
jgi:ABC-2 type transport system ATP-binding protein